MTHTLGQTWRDVQARLTPVEPSPREGRMLVSHVTGFDDQHLLKSEHEAFPEMFRHDLDALVAKRLKGMPLAYVLGFGPFWGRDWQVGPGVLIPRPDSETLVQAVLDVMPRDRQIQVAEVGVGSGALIGSVLLERPQAHGTATDISPTALAMADTNLRAAGVRARCHLLQGNLLEHVEGPLDIIFSNPPYISAAAYAALEACVRDFEPREALLADDDGLAIYKALIPQAAALLAPGGWLAVEIGFDQDTAVGTLTAPGLGKAEVRPDMAGRPRVVMWQRA